MVNAKAQAKNAAKANAAGNKGKKKLRKYTKPHYYKNKTLTTARVPKFPKKSAPHLPRMDKYKAIKYPLCTGAAMKEIEDHNTLTFICDVTANKPTIKAAVQALYDISVVNVNTLIRPDGQKKAYVKLSADHEALEVASTIGII